MELNRSSTKRIAYGNLETGDNSTVVTAALNSGAGPLRERPPRPCRAAWRRFTNLADNTAETITLKFTSGSLTPAVSSPVVVSPAVDLMDQLVHRGARIRSRSEPT